MCGITGMLVRDALSEDDVVEVMRLGQLAARRGPDDAGHWDDGRACALAFRRLSIVDLSRRGHQPMVSGDGTHVLVYNGEVYNFRELRRELEARGRTFRSSGDSEVVLQALVEWGEDALARFNGMFALAWYRPAAKTLVLARDPMGIKPLLWWWSPEAFVFGSQYDQVVRHRRCRRDRVDEGALKTYLRLGFLPAPHGVIDGTGQVEAGHVLEVKPGEAPRVRPFRTLAPAVPRAERLRGRDADEAVAAAVSAAVVRQTVSDVQVGTFLSGGVDSPLVTALMQGAADAPVPAFTIGTDDPESDESTPAAAYAEMLGVEHHLRRIDANVALGLVDDVARANTEPFGDYSSFPTLLVSALAAERVKTVLSGDGGDELFWGYPRFAKVRRARHWFRFPRPLRVAAYGATKPLSPDRRPARGILFPSIGDWYLDAHSGLRSRDIGQLAPCLTRVPDRLDRFALGGLPTDDELLQWMRMNEMGTHLPMILQKLDRASMHYSLEVRVPLLDLEVVEVAGRVDPTACLDGTIGKGVLRRTLARRVQAETIPVPKRGFTVPLGSWLRRELRPQVEELLLERDPFPTGMFDRDGIHRFCEAHFSGTRDLTRGIWNLLALQLWAQVHLSPLQRSASATQLFSARAPGSTSWHA